METTCIIYVTYEEAGPSYMWMRNFLTRDQLRHTQGTDSLSLARRALRNRRRE